MIVNDDTNSNISIELQPDWRSNFSNLVDYQMQKRIFAGESLTFLDWKNLLP